jgi:transcriptional regulator with XRE-family HTH domain
MMVRHTPTGAEYATCYRHPMHLVQPHQLTEAEKFNILYPTPELLTTTADKLRWHRYRLGLRQRDVADRVGLDRSTYIRYEAGTMDRYPPDKLSAIASVLGAEYDWLLDDYNRFLQTEPGIQVKTLRENIGLLVAVFAERMGVYATTVRKWESGQVLMSKKMWEKMNNLFTTI